MEIGKLGVWSAQDVLSADDAVAQARRIEAWGYGALWQPEAMGRNVLVHSGLILAHTTTLVVATGIANIYARGAVTTASGQMTLAEASKGRFLLGLGVSHIPMVEGVHRHAYGKPVQTMRNYLTDMASARHMAPRPTDKPLTLIAALGPKMLALAAELADGAHPYNVPPEHTLDARRILGPGKLLCPEQMVLLESDPAKARAAGRKALSIYTTLPNYLNNWLRLGFTSDDFENGGSDRLIDAIIAWGDEKAIRARIQAHWDAGADHVCIQSLRGVDTTAAADERILELLAPARS
jgi:probable F420-dependent oxidoreductase